MEWRRGEYVITDDRERMDAGAVVGMLRESYWAHDRPAEVVAKTVERSLCFGLFKGEQQVGFARVVTDGLTFAWICDVIIHPSHRGIGLGKWLAEVMFAHPEVNVNLQVLGTRDAHSLYERFGFRRLDERFMAARKREARAVV